MRLKISSSEYKRRIELVRDELAQQGADALVLSGAKRISYLTGYHILATERPMSLILPADTNSSIIAFVPRLEVDTAEQAEFIGEIWSYFEYPGEEPQLNILAQKLKNKGWDKKLLVDGDGYPAFWGYEGPRLSELLPNTEVLTTTLVQDMWQVKSKEEIEIIKETAIWGNLAHAKLQKFTEVGESEIEIELRASYEASREMLQALGPEFGGFSRGGWPCIAMYVTGKNSALPHSMSWNREIREGDVLVTGATGYIGGYASELERTMIVGNPTADQSNYFEIMLEAQTAGIEQSGPGVPLAQVDQAVFDVFAKHGVVDMAQHHTGHHLGFEAHEPPFIDRTAVGEMLPGQVYSIEPGIYVPGVAGYRHSDTILITDSGVEMITYYPRDMKSLIIES
jgi:Xaa-Pro aminopeptidase